MSKESIAIVFGTFAPMHKGHIDLIQRAKRENNKVVVVASGYKDDRGDTIGLNLQRRFRYIRETFHNDDLVKVVKLDETNLPPMPDGWSEWLYKLGQATEIESIATQISKNGTRVGESDTEIVFYVSELDYAGELNSRGFKTKYGSRNFGISATAIRDNPAKYWNFIARPFRRHFSKQVLIVGSASNGKTTLARDLGRYYSAPVSYEYSRHYQQKYNVRDDELQAKDYTNLLTGQYKQTQSLIDSNENRGLVIADTNSTVTKAYYDYYLDMPKDTNDAFNRLYQLTASEEKWDAVIFIKPTGTYVNDGYRDMTMADDVIRNEFSDYLDCLITTNHPNVSVYYIDGDYIGNYAKAIEIIDTIYKDI